MGNFEKLSLLVIVVVGFMVWLMVLQFRSMLAFDPDEAEAQMAAANRREAEALALIPGRVTGRVKSPDGRAVTRFVVRAVPESRPVTPASGVPASPTEPAPVPAAASPVFDVVSVKGAFAFDELLPGRYRMRVEAQGFAPATSDVVVVAPRRESPPMAIRLFPTGPSR